MVPKAFFRGKYVFAYFCTLHTAAHHEAMSRFQLAQQEGKNLNIYLFEWASSFLFYRLIPRFCFGKHSIWCDRSFLSCLSVQSLWGAEKKLKTAADSRHAVAANYVFLQFNTGKNTANLIH